jgi:hypothetical protein
LYLVTPDRAIETLLAFARRSEATAETPEDEKRGRLRQNNGDDR